MSLVCPHCKGWSADCEDLPKEQESRVIIGCQKCKMPFAISWLIEHRAEVISDAYHALTPALVKEIAEAVRDL